tara:strand:- start:7079 stop:9358 length:2280 start_codon:yes stop_codon:yes gene_type:complete
MMIHSSSRTPVKVSPALRMFIIATLSIAVAGHGYGQDDEEKEVDAEIQKRRQALSSWVFEPLALEGSSFRLHMDRHNSSFVLSIRRSNSEYYSSWGRKGFCSLRLSNGRLVPVDKVEELTSNSERIRFRAASSVGKIPPVWIEWRIIKGRNILSLLFDIPEESREQVSGIRLLDRALWVSDSDAGEVLVPRGVGELYPAANAAPLQLKLDRFQDLAAAAAENRYSLPVLGLTRLGGPLALCWKDPETAITIEREAVEGDTFPGKRGIFTSVDFSAHSAELLFLVPTEINMEILETARVYSGWVNSRKKIPSLRYKTSKEESLRSFIGAAMWRPSMTAEASSPLAGREIRYDFKQLAAISRHWKEVLGIERAAIVAGDWLATGNGGGGDLSEWNAAQECGGNEALTLAAGQIRSRGHLFGLSIDLEQLYKAPIESSFDRESSWQAAVGTARAKESLHNLKSLFDPQLLVIQEASTANSATTDWAQLLENRAALLQDVDTIFGLAGITPALPEDFRIAALCSTALHSKLAEPASANLFPLLPATFGHNARLSGSHKQALGPADAAGFLSYLLYGQAPVYQLPPGLYFEKPEETPSPGSAQNPSSLFAREGGWSQGRKLTPHDIFIKNTYEVASWLAPLCARNQLTSHRFLTPDGSVQESFFSADLRVLVNFGKKPWRDELAKVVLPPYGFYIRHPFFLAFCALEVDGLVYDQPAFFTVRSLEGKMYLRAEQVRIYQGMEPGKISLGGRIFKVNGELKTKIW